MAVGSNPSWPAVLRGADATSKQRTEMGSNPGRRSPRSERSERAGPSSFGSNPIVPAICERQRAAVPEFEARKSQPGTAERREATRPGPSSFGSNSERLAPLVFRRSRTYGSLTPIVTAVCEERTRRANGERRWLRTPETSVAGPAAESEFDSRPSRGEKSDCDRLRSRNHVG